MPSCEVPSVIGDEARRTKPANGAVLRRWGPREPVRLPTCDGPNAAEAVCSLCRFPSICLPAKGPAPFLVAAGPERPLRSAKAVHDQLAIGPHVNVTVGHRRHGKLHHAAELILTVGCLVAVVQLV